MDGTVTVLVGTTKGAFLIDGGAERTGWRVRGPFCDGWGINHVVGDPASGEIWAGGGGEWTGAGIWHSPDGGESWQVMRLTRGTTDDWAEKDPEFAAMIGYEPVELPFGSDFQQIWSVGVAPGVLFVGTKPANLLRSVDGGQSWTLVEGLSNHPSSGSWTPGAAGLVLHTILTDPERPSHLWCGISAARLSLPARMAA